MLLSDKTNSLPSANEHEQAMMTLQGMADHRFTSVSLFTNVFLGEIIYLRPSLPLNAKNSYDQLHASLERTGSWLPFQKLGACQGATSDLFCSNHGKLLFLV